MTKTERGLEEAHQAAEGIRKTAPGTGQNAGTRSQLGRLRPGFRSGSRWSGRFAVRGLGLHRARVQRPITKLHIADPAFKYKSANGSAHRRPAHNLGPGLSGAPDDIRKQHFRPAKTRDRSADAY